MRLGQLIPGYKKEGKSTVTVATLATVEPQTLPSVASVATVTVTSPPETTEPKTGTVAAFIAALPIKDDKYHLWKMLKSIPPAAHHKTITEYLRQWQVGFDAEPIEYRQQNAGRFRANVWLRTTGIATGITPGNAQPVNPAPQLAW